MSSIAQGDSHPRTSLNHQNSSGTPHIEPDIELCGHVDGDDLPEAVRGLRIRPQSPVNCLPTEIVAEIFVLVPTPTSECSIELSKLRPWQSLRDVREAVPLTSVCRSWRQVALSTPSLWSSILDLSNSGRSPLWLHYAHRCTVGPLFVGILGVPSRETIELLQRECLRVRELYFYAPHYPKSRNDVLNDLMALSLPRLKFCALTAYTYERTPTIHLAFGGPEMRKLALCGAFVPQLSPSLTHLILFNKISVPADELLDFLATTPHLQYLRMHEIRTVPSAEGSAEPGDAALPPRATLPALQTVLVTKTEVMAQSTEQDYFAYMGRVFSQLAYPAGCDISIGLIDEDDFLRLTTAFFRGKTVTSATLYKTTKSSPDYHFAASAADEHEGGPDFRCEFDIEYFDHSAPLGQSLVTVAASPEFASLRRLWATTRWVCKLLAAGVPLRNLCTLIIYDPHSDATRHLTIEDIAEAIKPSAEGGVPWPAMKLLAVKCRVSQPRPPSDRPWDVEQLQRTGYILAVREAARLRMDAGYPLALQILVCGSKTTDVLHYDARGQLNLHEAGHGKYSRGSKLRRAFFRHWYSGALEDWVNA